MIHDRMVETCEEQALRGLCRGQCNHRQALRPLTCRANDSDLVRHESVRCVFWGSTTMHVLGRCSTGLWKLLLEMCRTQLGPTLGVFFLHGFIQPKWLCLKISYTVQKIMAWNMTKSSFLVILPKFPFGVYGITVYRITNVEFNLFAMP